MLLSIVRHDLGSSVTEERASSPYPNGNMPILVRSECAGGPCQPKTPSILEIIFVHNNLTSWNSGK